MPENPEFSFNFNNAVKKHSENLFNQAVVLQDEGKLDAAINEYESALSIRSNFAAAHFNLGIIFRAKNKLDAAIDSYESAIEIEPNLAKAHLNLGILRQEKGELDVALEHYEIARYIDGENPLTYVLTGAVLHMKNHLDEAIESYKAALKIKPEYAEVYFQMGQIHDDKADLDAAILCYKNALQFNPDYSHAYLNLGVGLQMKGYNAEAIKNYKEALVINPNLVACYSNIGHALLSTGEVEAAKDSYKKALHIQPEYAEAYWNLTGTASSICEATGWLEECLASDSHHQNAQLMLSALKFYEGDEASFHQLIASPLGSHPFSRSFSWVFSLPELPKLYFTAWQFYDFVTSKCVKSRPFYEFGVWRGVVFKHLINTFKKGYGFDTFEGLPEDWHNEKKGSYTSDGSIPIVDGGEFIVGNFEDTLPDFFSVPRPTASLINFDSDLYSSTICALVHSNSVIDAKTVLIFDEFLMNPNWEDDESKALEEFCSENSFSYEVLAVSFFTKQVAVRLIKND
jgi:tetratricopeptide (TPR) repeat protein